MTPLKKTTGDPSRRSRGADPALERETNKIIRPRRRTPRRLAPTVLVKQLTPTGRVSFPPSFRPSPDQQNPQRRPTTAFLRVAPATARAALDGDRRGRDVLVSVVDRVERFRLTLRLFRRRFDGGVIYFFNFDFNFFHDASEFSVCSFCIVFISS